MKKSIYILAFGGFGIITTAFSVIGILHVLAPGFVHIKRRSVTATTVLENETAVAA